MAAMLEEIEHGKLIQQWTEGATGGETHYMSGPQQISPNRVAMIMMGRLNGLSERSNTCSRYQGYRHSGPNSFLKTGNEDEV